MVELKECPICHKENWKKLDYLRDHKYWQDIDYITLDEKCDMKICKECGFVTYDYVELDRLTDNYDRQRPVLNSGNIITCNRKNEYHETFLKEMLMGEECRDWNVLDVGCAQGSFLDSLAGYGLHNLYGTEFSTAFRAFGKHEYRLNITKEIDESVKYDFISYYHVLEHCQHPDKELQKARELLEDDGYLYIAVPTWFDKLEQDSGSDVGSFEELFHMNHVNCFTKQSLHNIINTNGFEIIKENEHIYGLTVLCKKSDIKMLVVLEDYKEIVKTLSNHKEAISLLHAKQFDDALKLEPKFPDVYIYKSLQKDNMQSLDKQVEILDEGLKHNPDCMRLLLQKGKIHFQWDENTPDKIGYYSNNIKTAEELFKYVLEYKSGNEDIYYFLSMIELKYKLDYDKAVEYMKECLRINPSKFHECWNIIATIYKEKECQK